MVVEQLPQPTWLGLTQDRLQKYAEFKVQHMINATQNIPNQAKLRVDILKDRLEDLESALKVYRNEVTQFRERKRVLEEQVRGRTEDELLAEAEGILTLPFVIGTRLNIDGSLSVMIRVVESVNGKQYEAGDFEINLNSHTNRSERVSWIRVPKTASGRDLRGGNIGYHATDHHKDIADAYIGRVFDVNDFDTYDTYEEYIVRVFDGLSKHYVHNYAAVEGEMPAALWSAQLSVEDTVNALRRMYSRKRGIERQIEQLARNITRYEHVVRETIDGIRNTKQELRLAKAELQELKRQAGGEINVDIMKIREELDYILALPGIMGLKFLDDGTPVFHFRASTVHEGRRYDMGDHEIRLRAHQGGGLGAINVHATRGGTIYTHNDGHYEQTISWFCFGRRADQVRGQFDAGTFGSMMHLVVNTMNAVNRGDLHYLARNYTEIPMNKVWRLNIKQPRQRPRRRPRTDDSQTRAVGQVAMMAAAM